MNKKNIIKIGYVSILGLSLITNGYALNKEPIKPEIIIEERKELKEVKTNVETIINLSNEYALVGDSITYSVDITNNSNYDIYSISGVVCFGNYVNSYQIDGLRKGETVHKEYTYTLNKEDFYEFMCCPILTNITSDDINEYNYSKNCMKFVRMVEEKEIDGEIKYYVPSENKYIELDKLNNERSK